MILTVVMTIHLDQYEYPGFRKGFYQIKIKDLEAVRRKINEILGVKQKTSFYHYLYGRLEPSQSKAKAIEDLFAEYGINDCWGMPTEFPQQ